ncbi:MAG: Wzz/FepE/Etk N-terminal domain-containing protein [Pseudomonadota bacterium]
MAKSESKSVSFRDFLRIPFARKKIIFFVFFGVVLLSLLVSLITPPTYQAETKILAKERKTESPLQPKYFYDYRTERVAFLQSQMEILQSDEVTSRVLQKLSKSNRPVTTKMIKDFQTQIKVISPKGYDITSSDVLLIQFLDNNPVRAAEGANLATDEYINYTYELRGKSAKQTGDFLEKQAQLQMEKMKQAEDQVKNYEGRVGPELAFLIATVKNKGANTDLITFNNNYLNAVGSLKETESYLSQLRAMVHKGIVPQKIVRENPVLGSVRDNIIKLENQLSNLRSQFTDNYPKNIMLLNEIARNKQLFNREVKADLDGRSVDIIAIESRVKSLKQVVDQYSALAQKQLEYSRIYRNYEVFEEGYQELLRDIQKARLSEAMDKYKLASVEVVDRAKVPRVPIKPDIIFNTLIGGLIGLLLGLGLAFVTDGFDHTLKSVEEVERHLDIPVLGSLPRY